MLRQLALPSLVAFLLLLWGAGCQEEDESPASSADQSLTSDTGEVFDLQRSPLYGPCGLPQSSTVNSACREYTCVVDYVFECESRLCGIYQGSGPYCTQRCSGPDDVITCGAGSCHEWVPGLGSYYCVAPSP